MSPQFDLREIRMWHLPPNIGLLREEVQMKHREIKHLRQFDNGAHFMLEQSNNLSAGEVPFKRD
jgi:hypothetical protein